MGSSTERGEYERRLAKLPRAEQAADQAKHLFFTKDGPHSYLSNYHRMRLWDEYMNWTFSSSEQYE